MFADRQGNILNGATPLAVDLFDSAIEAFNVYRGDPVSLVNEALQQAPEFAMAHILRAYLFGLATEPEAAREARRSLVRAKGIARSEREQSHISALECLLSNNWTDAALILDRHNMQHPHDMLGLQAGHLMDFYRANARNLRDRIARVLPKWSEDRPGYSVVLGMYAFGLEEAGEYAAAESVGREAIARQPLDCWAHHAVAHVMEMQGRAEDGIDWMRARAPFWSGDDNFFKVHNWWHLALYHFDLGQIDDVMALYDNRVRAGASTVALDLVDASALLWRLTLDRHDVAGRWAEVAEAWDNHADGQLYPFNDWHAAMAYLGAQRPAEVDRLIALYRSADTSSSETARWAQSTGLPLIEGFKAFWQGDYDGAVTHLHSSRHIVNVFGGSHAQRDVIDWTLVEAAVRSGNSHTAQALANERIAVKPHSPINRSFIDRAKALLHHGGLAA